MSATQQTIKLGIVGFSASLNPELYRRALAFLERSGVEVLAPFDPSTGYGSERHLFSATSVDERVAAFKRLVEDPTVSAIVAARGAYGSMEILEHLDYEAYARNPIPIFGSSDITALLLAISKRVPAARCYHGPSVQSAFAKAAESKAALESAEAVLATVQGTYRYPAVRLSRLDDAEGSAEVQGRLIGGNLTMLACLLGTPWQPQCADRILFLEEIGERPFRVHRMLLQLKLSGVLKGVRAIVLGDFIDCLHPKNLGPDVDAVLKDALRDLDVAVYRGLPCGHGERNLPLPIGAEARISAAGDFEVCL